MHKIKMDIKLSIWEDNNEYSAVEINECFNDQIDSFSMCTKKIEC